MKKENNHIIIGAITDKYGLKGLVKVKWFTESIKGLEAYNPIKLSNDKEYFLTVRSQNKGQAICKLENIDDVNEAELLKGEKIYANRSSFPNLNNKEFYQTDLVGCEVNTLDNKFVGKVSAVYDFGAGPLLEIGEDLILFNDNNFPKVNVIEKKIFIKLDEEIENNK
tara:strand:+ start:85 stop:585 length:501 start_codon:yes stop_codon:yes gene_type:complete